MLIKSSVQILVSKRKSVFDLSILKQFN